jgi:transcriptional regulator with XRE-family HTH domain
MDGGRVRGGQPVSDEDRSVGALLSAARRATDLTQAEVARRLGVAQSRIAKLEVGSRRLLFSEAVSLADLYGVPITSFVPRDPTGARQE